MRWGDIAASTEMRRALMDRLNMLVSRSLRVGVKEMKLARNVIVLDLGTTSMLSPTHPYYTKRRGFATSQAKVPQISPGPVLFERVVLAYMY